MPLFGFKRLTLVSSAFAAASAALLAVGCAKTSPAVGTWTGTTPMMKSTATLTLAADGTGTFSIPPVMQNKAVTWKEGENKTIDLSMGGAAPSGGSAAASGAGGASLPATLGEDGKTMTIQLPMAGSVQLTKSEAAK